MIQVMVDGLAAITDPFTQSALVTTLSAQLDPYFRDETRKRVSFQGREMSHNAVPPPAQRGSRKRNNRSISSFIVKAKVASSRLFFEE
jgi:hypothetical protein